MGSLLSPAAPDCTFSGTVKSLGTVKFLVSVRACTALRYKKMAFSRKVPFLHKYHPWCPYMLFYSAAVGLTAFLYLIYRHKNYLFYRFPVILKV